MKDFTKEERIEQSIRLRKARIIRGLSIDEFSEKIGMSSSGYQKVERGQNAISRSLLRRIWQEYYISADYILFGEQQNAEEIISSIEGSSDIDKLYIFWNLAKYFVLSKRDEKFHRGITRQDIEDKINEIIK